MLALLASRALYRALFNRGRINKTRLPFDRWAALFASTADELLAILLNRHGRTQRTRLLVRFLRAEALDPNRARIPLPYKAQMGLHQPA